MNELRWGNARGRGQGNRRDFPGGRLRGCRRPAPRGASGVGGGRFSAAAIVVVYAPAMNDALRPAANGADQTIIIICAGAGTGLFTGSCLHHEVRGPGGGMPYVRGLAGTKGFDHRSPDHDPSPLLLPEPGRIHGSPGSGSPLAHGQSFVSMHDASPGTGDRRDLNHPDVAWEHASRPKAPPSSPGEGYAVVGQVSHSCTTGDASRSNGLVRISRECRYG